MNNIYAVVGYYLPDAAAARPTASGLANSSNAVKHQLRFRFRRISPLAIYLYFY